MEIMSAIGIVILQMAIAMTLRSVDAQFGSGGGGPSTFGYDGSSACSKPYSRYARARFEKLPCDFRRQNWCTIAGSAYPWHAVRRFVHENQGLMRRMYGDERHINILKAELEKNDIELEYEDRYQRYPDESRQFQYDDEYEFANFENQQERSMKSESVNDEDESQRRSFKEPISADRGKKNTKEGLKFTRSVNNIATESTTEPNLSSTIVIETTTEKSSLDSKKSATTIGNDEKSVEGSSPISSSTESVISAVKNDLNSTNEQKIGTTLPDVTLADIARIKNSSINEIPGKSSINLENRDEEPHTELPIVAESTIELEAIDLEIGTTSSSVPSISTISSIDRIDENTDLQEDEEDSKIGSVVDQIFAASEQNEPMRQQFRPRPEYKPAESKPETGNLEGQFFQDVAAKDHQEQPILNLRGINACPVKEEVVAPFWANNTRGEVLALLNLYPFEQYVHWEKCAHENRQMYCRDGCKCEQQYRLHRLLAYDPNNECRGIFSDWFKFPSCCVCRCYGMPVEFRVTSRSPRIQKQKLRLRPPGRG